MEKTINTAARDEAILRDYRQIGDAARLAEKHGVCKTHVLRLIHNAEVGKQVSRATEYAQAVMQAGSVVCALPASILKTNVGADAFIRELENAIRVQARDLNVVIAVAVIPVEEVEGFIPAEPIENPRAVSATLQAKAVNAGRKAEVTA